MEVRRRSLRLVHVTRDRYDQLKPWRASENATTGAIRLFNFFAATNKAARGKVWSLYDLEQVFSVDLRIAQDGDGGVDDFGEIVRRDLRRHADRDSLGTVEQEIRDPRGQQGRLVERFIIV